MRDPVNVLLDPLRRRLANLVARAVVQLVTDSSTLQHLQLAVLTDETRDGCERFQQYGFTSVPVAPNAAGAAEAVVLWVGGLRDHPLIVAVDDRRFRKTNLAAGEAALYNHQGVYVLLKTGQVVEVNAPIDLVDGAGLKVDGTQVVGEQGAAVADSTATAASVSAQLNALLARLRAHGLIAS
jgi:phage baseplate assembly protein V